jgi:hypothetical protein
MALTAKQILDLNQAMEANQRANLGTVISNLTDTAADVIALEAQAIIRGSYIAVADDATADEIDFVTGLSAIAGWVVDIYRANVKVGGDVVVTAATGTLTVADGSVYKITADDVINYIVW